MIRSSVVFKGAALALALGAHGLMAVSLSDAPVVEIESDAGAPTAVLGNSFADMTAGTLSPKTSEAKLAPVAPQALPAVTPEQVLEPQETRETTAPQRPSPAPKPPVKPMAAATPVNTMLAMMHPVQPVQPVQATASAPPTEPLQTVSQSKDEIDTAVNRSIRPKTRSREVEKRAAAAKPKPKAGNAKRNAKAGSASGSRDARARNQGQGQGQAKRAGNAAASNYPGRVMARISSVGRPSVNTRGTAVVRFSINARGGLASVGIARSSGSRRLDQAATQVIYNAAPFPRPPAGARRSFSINITGR